MAQGVAASRASDRRELASAQASEPAEPGEARERHTQVEGSGIGAKEFPIPGLSSNVYPGGRVNIGSTKALPLPPIAGFIPASIRDTAYMSNFFNLRPLI
jgi:hypothetical protein